MKAAFPDMAMWIAMERVKEAKEVNAKAMVTACPFYVRNLQDAAQEYTSRLRYLT